MPLADRVGAGHKTVCIIQCNLDFNWKINKINKLQKYEREEITISFLCKKLRECQLWFTKRFCIDLSRK